MRTLTWVNLEAVKTCLHNNLSGADMTPFHGNSQPRVAASPSARTDEEIGRAGILQELPVDFLNLFGNRRIVRWCVSLSLDVYDVLYVAVDAVSYCRMRAQETVLVGNCGEVFVKFHSVVHHWSDLQEAELASSVGMEIDGKLYLDGAFHLILSILQHFAHQFWQRKDITLQDTSKRDDLAVATLVETIVDALIDRVVGGTNPLKCAVAFSLSNRHLDEIEAIIHTYLASFLRTLCP